MRFDVDCALVPIRQAIVVHNFKGVARDESERVCGGTAPDEVAVIRKLEVGGGLLLESLLEQDLARSRLQ